ncbi:MAG: DUF3810 domain-containing protein [Ferruginibacter sp.]
MKNKKYWILIVVLLVFAVIIHLFSYNAARVELYYSGGVYPYISIFLRNLLGWLPVSVGDILYGLAGIWLLIKIIKGIKTLFKKDNSSKAFLPKFQRTVIALLLIYILFNALWGINYNRKGIASQLGLSMTEYSLSDLKMLNGILLQKVNESNELLLRQPPIIKSSKEIFQQSLDAYDEVNKHYSFLNYRPASIKASLWGWLGNYVGFLGYYNPFTGEGQINTNIPKFLQPFINCHEIAHQIGYAKENEANFVGYLAAVSSKDKSFHYSVYIDLFLYANRNLYNADSLAAKAFAKQLLPAVKQDLKEWRQFNLHYRNPVEPVIRWLYGKYLESNEQPSGMLSYDEVTGFLIAYYKKYGKL